MHLRPWALTMVPSLAVGCAHDSGVETAQHSEYAAPVEATSLAGARCQAGQCRCRRPGDDAETALLIAPLNDEATALCVAAERTFLAKLDGSCRTTVAGHAVVSDAGIEFRGPAIQFLNVGVVLGLGQHAGDDPALPGHLQSTLNA